MDLLTIRSALMWCAIINYIVLLIWFALMLFAHDAFYRIHSRFFSITAEQFDVVMYGSMAVYKIGLILLNLVPFIALCIVLR